MTTSYARCVSLLGLAALAASCNVSTGSDSADPPGDDGVDVPAPPDLWTEGCGVGVLATGLASPVGLALSGDRLIVTTTDKYGSVGNGFGNVYDVALDGSGAVELASGLGVVTSTATDGTDLFVSLQGQGLRRVSLTTGAVTTVPEVTEASAFLQLLDGKLYYNTFFYGNETEVAPSIRALDLTTGVVTDAVPSQGTDKMLYDFATDGVDVFYQRYTLVDGFPGEIVKQNIATGDETVIASGLQFMGEMVIHGNRLLYVTVHGNYGEQVGLVHDRPVSGGVEQVYVGQNSAHYVTASDTSIYWSGSKGGDPIVSAIQRVGVGLYNAGTITTHTWDVPMIPCPGGICWTDADEGTVKRYVECGG